MKESQKPSRGANAAAPQDAKAPQGTKTKNRCAVLQTTNLDNFIARAKKGVATEVLLSVHAAPSDSVWPNKGEGVFSIRLTARSADGGTIYRWSETVEGVTHIDAHVNREGTKAKIAVRETQLAVILKDAGFAVSEGEWQERS